MKVLVTGGAGYIGSHACVELLQAGHYVVVIDNFSNSSVDALKQVANITKTELSVVTNGGRLTPFVFEQVDIRDRAELDRIFSVYSFDCVMHFAGLKAVGESVKKPLEYYDNNIVGSLALYEVMQASGVKRIIFSSSATVYGDPHTVPINESFPLSVTNPYGRSKFFNEGILSDLHTSDSQWSVVLLRYFNPIGAHKSGLIGENPSGIPNNLMPYIGQVAIGKLERLSVFGNDYPTKDGTGIRDYIHVIDLAKGHVAALDYLSDQDDGGILTVNLGTGKGYSVLEIINEFEKVSGERVPYSIVDRRIGDVAECYADPSYARKILGWKAELDLERMCKDTWRWINKK
jgi:UDP-glucose 4-epimerase